MDFRYKKINVIKKILIEEGELNDMNYYFMKNTVEYRNKYLVNKDGDMFLTVDSLIHLNNLITGSNNLELRKVNVRPAAYYTEFYMDWRGIESALYALADHFNGRLITKKDFCERFLNDIHPLKDENGRICKILFA